MKNRFIGAMLLLLPLSSIVQAAEYVIDTKGAHASINFKVKHLKTSWLTGRFNTFSGHFSYDKDNIEASKISVKIDTASVDTNHAKRDKHIRSDDYLDVSKYSIATFESTKVESLESGDIKVTGDLSLHGVTKPIVIDVQKIGEGADPWGGYRVGFTGTTQILMPDFGIENDYGAMEFELHIEGKRQ